MYFIKTPSCLKKIFNKYTWHLEAEATNLYLTFDDGPHAQATPFVLNELDKVDAKASFFCIGKNVIQHPDIYKDILRGGHAIGNHTNNHLNGWKTKHDVYIKNVDEASKLIQSNLFRPPYGRITNKQGESLLNKGFKIIMWDVLSGDFDINLSPQQCLSNVTSNAKSGSIIVFHDSEKAFNNLKFALPRTIDFFAEKGYQFKSLL